MVKFDKIVIVTKKTWLEELIIRFNTKAQAKFYIEHSGGNFEIYENAHKQYYASLEKLKKSVPQELKFQIIEKDFLPNFLFGRNDLIVTIGQDGLVINTAKYLDNQLIFAINPDPERIDGILNPFFVDDFKDWIKKIREDEFNFIRVTIAVAELNTQQRLFGVNDIFIGHRSHGSARYTITHGGWSEKQSSSGIIVSTGAGSTGWFRAIVTGAICITNEFKKYNVMVSKPTEDEYRFPWDAGYLYFSVREPFESKISKANIVFGQIYGGEKLIIESHMPENGVIFSDGIEKDFMEFNSGSIAEISIADKTANLIVR
jgi:NAD kinase